MTPTRQGSFRLFRFAGVDVYLHWSWFLIAVYGINLRAGKYSSMVWPVLEYLALFLIVLLHEFGHALACRQVGGQATQIVLWPLGGVAYVAPPPRPGAVLWSIVAGPLVNVLLVPVLALARFAGKSADWIHVAPNVYLFLRAISYVNYALLFFNLLPIYPLDGGKILWALLWFVFGRARGLMIAVVVGFVAVLALIPFVVTQHEPWLYVIVAFILLNCWKGWVEARALARFERTPRREGFACPSCKAAPMRGDLWRCGKCGKSFDTFATHANCPHCGAQYNAIACFECGSLRPISEWIIPPPLPPKSV